MNVDVESDEEEKRAILADENILQLEETQKVPYSMSECMGVFKNAQTIGTCTFCLVTETQNWTNCLYSIVCIVYFMWLT